jgi:hypothetical protein
MSSEVMVKSFESNVNGGITIILESVAQAIEAGRSYHDNRIAEYQGLDPKTKFKVRMVKNPRTGKSKSNVMNLNTLIEKIQARLDCFNSVAKAIECGDTVTRKAINELADKLVEMVLELQPHIAQKFDGFERAEDGITAAVELVAIGDDRPCFRRKRGGEPKPGAGDGAYRVIINTDVPWWASARDNAAVMGALVMLLQRYGPVEIWIQQGWLGGSNPDEQGVTLFKLDFTGGFESTQLAFWCGHPNKDNVFSRDVNCGLGRENSNVSVEAEIPCDLYLHGCWMQLHGIAEWKWNNMTPEQQRAAMVQWLAKTLTQITYPDEALEVA